jgi:hypothetical protein
MMKKSIVVALLVVGCLVGACAVIFALVEQRRECNINACTSTQHFVNTAIAEFAGKYSRTNGSPVELADILPYLPSGCSTQLWTECRAGGAITFRRVGEPPSCSIHGCLLK